MKVYKVIKSLYNKESASCEEIIEIPSPVTSRKVTYLFNSIISRISLKSRPSFNVKDILQAQVDLIPQRNHTFDFYH